MCELRATLVPHIYVLKLFLVVEGMQLLLQLYFSGIPDSSMSAFGLIESNCELQNYFCQQMHCLLKHKMFTICT